MAATASRISISSRTSSISHSHGSAPASSMPPSSNPQSPALVAKSLASPSAPSPAAVASLSVLERPFRWLLLDVAESSRPFLEGLATATAVAESGSVDRPSVASSPSYTTVQQKHLSAAASVASSTVGQLDKRLSMPFGGSANPNVPSGPTKKPSLISRLRSGSTSISSAEKESKATDAAASQPPSGTQSPLMSPATQETHLPMLSRQVVAAFGSSNPDGASLDTWASSAAQLLKQCGVALDEASVGQAAAARLDPKAVVQLAQRQGVDAVYLGGGPRVDRVLATGIVEALLADGPASGVKAVVVDPVVTRALTSQDASALISLAAQGTQWLALPTKWGKGGHASACTLIQDCVRDSLVDRKLYSKSFPWDETLVVLETLDELRQTPASSPTFPVAEAFPGRLAKIDDLSDTSVDSTGSVVLHSPRTPSDVADDHMADASTAPLRAKLQEVQHILRQKNALIAALEQQSRSGASSGSPTLNGRSSSPASTFRHRKSSLNASGDRETSSHPSTPVRTRKSSAASIGGDTGTDGAATPRRSMSGHPGAAGARTRKTSRSSVSEHPAGSQPTTPLLQQYHRENGSSTPAPIAGGAGAGVGTAKETKRSTDHGLVGGFSDSFRSPTVASENRRIASLTQQANGLANYSGAGGGGASGGSGKVIHALTTELEEARSQLETMRTRLRAAQTQTSMLQRQHDDLKESLSRTRLENESHGQMLARKDRQVSEALERARKAEQEAKELGRSSREWGTRVREVEAQLGQERIVKARAEAQYEALSASWKATRERMETDVAELKQAVVGKVEENLKEAKRLCELKEEMGRAWKVRDGEKGELEEVLERLKMQQAQVEEMVERSVGALVKRLERYEEATRAQDEEVEYVGRELRRILRLMRSGSTDPGGE
ncbi:hypothetical protein ACQY0O_008074 [Thecaphora frezii]